MTKYRAIGLCNFVVAVIYGVESIAILFLLPSAKSIYQDTSNSIGQSSLTKTYIIIAIEVILITANVASGLKLFSKNAQTQQKYFISGVISLVIAGLVLGYLTGSAILSLILPIYSTTAKF